MITLREATLADVVGIREIIESEYDAYYPHAQFYDTDALARMVYADDTILLVAIDSDAQRVAGTASVVFSIGAYNDLVGEFGRLVVHPEFRGRGIGGQLMEARLARVQTRLHVGIVENRSAHSYSQRISTRFGFAPVGFIPSKVLLQRRESIALYARHFDDALKLRRNNPRIIPEASAVAGFALENCGLPRDAIIDDTSPPYPVESDFELAELKTEGYTSLLRIERGRLRNRDVFGPVRLHYGLFHLQARHSHYLIARRNQQIVGGVGFMLDDAEKAVRIFELISLNDEPVRFLLQALLHTCERDLDVAHIEIDVSAYAPRMQRTLLELGFLPVGFIPANVFHEVERLDVLKMSKLLVPFEVGEVQLCDQVRPLADVVIRSFSSRNVLPLFTTASKESPLFAGLSDEQRDRLLNICRPRSFQPGDFLFRRGDVDGTMYLILSGTVDLLSHGSRYVAGVAKGQCVGEMSLLHAAADTPVAHSLDARAHCRVETASFGHGDFCELIRRRPDIGLAIYRNLAVDIRQKLTLSPETFLSTGPR